MATTKKTTTTAKKAPVKKATAEKKTTAKKAVKKVQEPQHIGLVRDDSWLEPFEDAIRGRHDHALWKIGQLTQNGKKTLSDFASGHLYYGLHKLAKGWVFREWAPNDISRRSITKDYFSGIATRYNMINSHYIGS